EIAAGDLLRKQSGRRAASPPPYDPRSRSMLGASTVRLKPQRRGCWAESVASCLLELALFGYPLVCFSRALDPVIEVSGVVRKLTNDLVETIRRHPERITAAQLNFLTYPKPMRRHARLPWRRGPRADGLLC